MSKLEKTFQTKLKRYLETKSYVVKFNASGISKVGVPDVLCCYKGLFVGIECKKEDGEISNIQQWNINDIRKNGGFGVCIRSDQFNEFVNFFENENWEGIGGLSLENEKEIAKIIP